MTQHVFSFLKNKKTVQIIILTVSVLIAAVILIVSAGWYPVAIVSGTSISVSEYTRAYNLSYSYYGYLLQGSKTASDDEALRDRLKEIVLQGLIDSVLIQDKLRESMTAKELRVKTEEKIGVVWNDPDARKMLIEMTKASEGDIRALYLEPEARRQILDEVLKSEGTNTIDWLATERKNVKIIRFS